jgi:hypothetical protein
MKDENGNTGKLNGIYLLPNYDEYIVSYKDRSSSIDAKHIDKADPRGTLFNNTVIVNGKIVGTWRKDFRKTAVHVEVTSFKPLSKVTLSALNTAVKRYAKFLAMKEYQLQIESL